MAATIKDAMKKALSQKGTGSPKSAQGHSLSQQQGQRVAPVTQGQSRVETGGNRPAHTGSQLRSSEFASTTAQNKVIQPSTRTETSKSAEVNAGNRGGQTAVGRVQAPPVVRTPPPNYTLKITKPGTPTCLISDEADGYRYVAPAKVGTKGQAHAGAWDDEREAAIGLDFGTSSVKVIIGDSALDKAFAVPFCDASDIHRYLLPSRLYETDSEFSLAKGSHVHRDLKLSLLANPGDDEAQVRVVALMALVIRHARGWLLSKHRDVYRQTNILWKLAVGLPAAHHLQPEHQELFLTVSKAAWLAATSNKQVISRDLILGALSKVKQLAAGLDILPTAEDVEISVVPEIAAQIYGYVASNSFDGKAKNLFLMVDVGAGTIDSSVFRVKAGRGRRYKFTFYTSEVRPNGVMNLHRNRTQWWESALDRVEEESRPDITALHDSKFSTDRMRSIPESFAGYFSRISVQFRKGVEDPDQHFFMKRVVAQARGKTVWKAWNQKLLGQADLQGIPMFLCGGGARMQFYRKLEEEMQHMPGCTWLNAKPRPLAVPKILVAPGLSSEEYDRLSVAFGLSFLEVSEFIKATPNPQILPDKVSNWQDNYVGKDQC